MSKDGSRLCRAGGDERSWLGRGLNGKPATFGAEDIEYLNPMPLAAWLLRRPDRRRGEPE